MTIQVLISAKIHQKKKKEKPKCFKVLLVYLNLFSRLPLDFSTVYLWILESPGVVNINFGVE